MDTREEERIEQTQKIRRHVAETWPDTPSKEHVLHALDWLVIEASESSRADTD
jgi:hypothetical protein